jgi:AcrR family transcriptional regulator
VAVEKLTPERRRELTRTALIDSARHAFAQKGYEGASLDEIAANAGFTRGAIYKHFDNKEDLFLAVMAEFNVRMLGSFAELLDVDVEAATDPTSIARMLMGSELSDPEMWALSIEFDLFEYRNPGNRQRSAEGRRRNRERVSQFLEENSTANGFILKFPAETLAAILLNATDGFVHAARLDPDAEGQYAKFLELFLPVLFDFPTQA